MWLVLCAALLPMQVEPASQPAEEAAYTPQDSARALVRQGDEYGRLGQTTAQLQTYRRALELDPQLVRDPQFVARFEQSYLAHRRAPVAPRPLPVVPSTAQQPAQPFPRAPAVAPQRPAYAPPPPPLRNEALKPRQGRYIGAGLTVGPQAVIGLSITSFLFQHLQLTVTGDLWMPAITVDAKVHILRYNLTPYLGGGVHLALPIDVAGPTALDLWRTGYLYVATGLQYMTDVGFFVDAGIALVPGRNALPGKTGTVSVLPSIGIGWAWRSGARR